MKNKELSQIFYEIADFLRMEKIDFKPYAYERAATVLASLEEDTCEIYKKEGIEGLKKIPGVGESIAQKIEEYLKTGKIRSYEELKGKTPINLREIIKVEGMGPKRAKILYEKLGIKTLKDLEKAAKAGKITPLFGFGQKTEKNILEGIEFLKRSKGRFLLGEILPVAYELEENLKRLREVKKISVAGSVRRKKETIGDIDFLVVTNKPKVVMDYFVSLPDIEKIWGKGTTKSSVRLKQGFDVDLRAVPVKSYGAALQYFTGSKEHNILTRKIAIEKGLKLSEYGLFRGNKMIAGKTEKEIYKALGMEYPAPEIRENQGEIEAALQQDQGKANGLPKLIGLKDIKGDLHCHSDWNGGANTISEMAETATSMDYEYLGIADHTKFLRIEHGLDEVQLAEQRKEINKLNSKFEILNSKQIPNSLIAKQLQGAKATGSKSKIQNKKLRILQGCEANILNDGSIDIKDEALKKLDYTIAGIHSSFKMEKEKMTERLIKAMKNPHIDIISHPTGRILKRRDEYQIDFEKILRAAKEFGVILEINSFPERLDLNDKNIRAAKEAGVKMVINTDSHHKDQLRFMEFGIFQARRGWAEKKDIVNTQSLNKLLKFFK